MSSRATTRRWRHRLEYFLLAALLFALRWLPRRLARALGGALGSLGYRLHRRWRSVGRTNLALAFPEKPPAERDRILRRAFRQLGWGLAEFGRFPRHTAASLEPVIVYDGLEHYQRAAQGRQGLLYLTAHVGAWELGPLLHSLRGYRLAYVNRPLDNPYVDALVNRFRQRGGNLPISRRQAARAIFEQLQAGRSVGVLLDQNVVEGDGNVFVDFFTRPASTSAGLARIALRTGAPVVPGFVLWDERLGKYRLRFEPPVEVVRTGDPERDVVETTARFTRIIEATIRQHPEQWLWIHRRWKTRPPGHPPVYSS